MLDWENILVIDGNFDSLNTINDSLTRNENEFINIDIYKEVSDGTKKARGHYTDGVRDVLTKDQIRLAESVADYITDAMKKSASRSGGYFEGLEHKLKEEDSLNRKLRDRKSGGGNGELSSKILKEASEDIHDILRFTLIFEPDKFVDNFFAFQDIMKEKGIRFVKIKNTFDATNTYKGVNTFMLANVDGVGSGTIEYVFEVQFHTKESFDAKEETHDWYDIERDKKKPQSERDHAALMQARIFSSVSAPMGYQLIKEMNELD